MKRLENKVAVVTGGNSGIGLATAKELIEQGAKVIVTGRNRSMIEEAVTKTGATGIVSDQSDLAAIDSLVDKIKSDFGKVDILFLNAGVAEFAPFEYASEDHYDRVMNINVKGVFFTLQKMLPILNDNGSVIFNSSSSADLGMPNTSVYAASKAALLSFTKVFAAELAARKIRVNSVSPGPIETPIFGKLGMTQGQVDELSEAVGKKTLLNRFGKPEEIAKTVSFLASDDASFITGAEIKADGGVTVNTLAG
jgi:NAD(P)-dependent dehydrogenase (short-subunit alcohol dehydrogenase family)